jgi:hypothetical protein
MPRRYPCVRCSAGCVLDEVETGVLVQCRSEVAVADSSRYRPTALWSFGPIAPPVRTAWSHLSRGDRRAICLEIPPAREVKSTPYLTVHRHCRPVEANSPGTAPVTKSIDVARVHVTVSDPDLDPTGEYARLLVDVLAEALADLDRSR